MRTELCELFGIDVPIFAFTHCRDVVVAVSNAGGMGVLGAVGFSPEQLETELAWIDERIGDKPYGVDTVIPNKYEGMDELDPKKLEARLEAAIPAEHREFADKLLADHGVPELPEDEQLRGLLGWTVATALPQHVDKNLHVLAQFAGQGHEKGFQRRAVQRVAQRSVDDLESHHREHEQQWPERVEQHHGQGAGRDQEGRESEDLFDGERAKQTAHEDELHQERKQVQSQVLV